MKRCQQVNELRAAVESWRLEGRPVGLVATMGALHEGHLSLARYSVERDWATVATVFVNPLQFGPNEDLDRYPRDIEQDTAMLESAGVHLLFAPSSQIMFPRDFQSRVIPGALALPLCGASRDPGHFQGVTTVVSKLLNLVDPDHALFGQKDYQQARVLQRMATDLNFRTRLHILPTVREPDGLAMSSRNQYLSTNERLAAPRLHRSLRAVETAFEAGERDAETLTRVGLEVLQGADSKASAAPNRGPESNHATKSRHADLKPADSRLDLPSFEVEYLEVVDDETLEPLDAVQDSGVVAVAARLGRTRLIDNLLLGAAKARLAPRPGPSADLPTEDR